MNPLPAAVVREGMAVNRLKAVMADRRLGLIWGVDSLLRAVPAMMCRFRAVLVG